MSAVAAKPQAGGAINPTAMAVGAVMVIIILALCWYVSPGAGLMALVGVIVGGVLIGSVLTSCRSAVLRQQWARHRVSQQV